MDRDEPTYDEEVNSNGAEEEILDCFRRMRNAIDRWIDKKFGFKRS